MTLYCLTNKQTLKNYETINFFVVILLYRKTFMLTPIHLNPSVLNFNFVYKEFDYFKKQLYAP